MILRRLLIATILLASTTWSQAQQINAVPDYVFRNQMSVGRNAVTDTAAYFSIGPRYGATKGFMPPIVGDTATFSSGKRNGLLIFSVQKNKFLYWDSVRVQWSDMAGSSGAYIVAGDTAAMLLPYLRKADTTAMLGNYVRHAGYGLTKSGQSFLVDTLNISTRAWRQKGLDSLAALEVSGSGTTNYVPKFTAASTIGNSQIVDNAASGVNIGAKTTIRDDGPFITGGNISGAGNNFAIGTTGGSALMIFTNSTQRIQVAADGNVGINATGALLPLTVYNPTLNTPVLEVRGGGGSSQTRINLSYGNTTSSTLNGDIFASTTDFALRAQPGRNIWFGTGISGGSSTERLRIFDNGRVFVGASPVDNGYQFDINGTLRSVNGANFATSSGNVGINRTSTGAKLDVQAESGAWGFFLRNNVGNTTIAARNDGRFLVGNGTVDNFAVTETGNVGIGTASPANAKLVVEGSSAGTIGAIMSTDIGGTTSFLRMLADIASQNLINWQTGTALRFATSTQAYGTFAEHARINSNGELLINTTSDAGDYKLQVSGNIYNTGSAVLAATGGDVLVRGTNNPLTATNRGNITLNGTASNIVAFTNGSSATGYLFQSTSDMQLFNNTATGNLSFYTNAALAGRFTPAGEFLLNTDGTDAGDYKLQVAGNVYATGGLTLTGTGSVFTRNTANTSGFDVGLLGGSSVADAYIYQRANAAIIFGTNNTERGRINSAGEWIIDASGTDAGDYKLQVVGNARIGTGKLDIASNTTFGLGIARSGTSEVAGQIYNSNGILYTGVESSAGGQIFTGSSAYAAVIGSGANYPLQFATNNITRATMTTSGNLLLGFATDSYFLKFQVNGSIFSNNQIITQGVNAQISADSSANISPLYISNQSLTGTSAQGMIYGNGTWNTTGNPSLIDLNLTNTASGATSNYMKITDGTNTFRVTKAAEVVTAAPTGGSIRKWKLGEAATVSPTSPNRTIRVEIDGTVYYLHAKTTND